MIRNTASGVLLGLTLLQGVAQLAIARESQTVLALPQAALVPLAAESPSPPAGGDLTTGSDFKDCAQCPTMVVVPPGSFTMGAPSTEPGRVDNEGPQHVVTIAQPFAVGKYEITFDEWEACVAERTCARADDSGFGRGRRPVINVSYENVKRYLAWLSDKTKKKYRLLSEAEWEYAARAGSDKSRFWGDSADSACEYANVFNQATRAKYRDSERAAFNCNDGYVETAPVGSFKPNKFGLYDMLGNVWEWVEDCWNVSYTGAPANGTAWNAGDCSKRVLRGGGWYFGPGNVRLAKRLKNEPSKRGHDVGFRVARTLP